MLVRISRRVYNNYIGIRYTRSFKSRGFSLFISVWTTTVRGRWGTAAAITVTWTAARTLATAYYDWIDTFGFDFFTFFWLRLWVTNLFHFVSVRIGTRRQNNRNYTLWACFDTVNALFVFYIGSRTGCPIYSFSKVLRSFVDSK